MIEPAPWSYPVAWPRRGAEPMALRLTADQPTCVRIAKFLDLESVERLEAEVSVRPWLDGMELRGRIAGEAIRLCGVTLEPFMESIDTAFDFHVVPEGSPNAPESHAGEVVIDLEGDDPPDVVPGDSVDVAGYVVEAVALALDPFPRKPGATFEPPVDTTSLSPFAILRKP